MPEDIKVPGIGNVDKKYVIAGVVVGAGVAVIVYIRSKKNAQAAAANSTSATSSGLVTDPAGNQCAALGTSGYCPGTPEDLAYQQQYADGSGYGYGTGSDYGYPGGGAYTSSAGLVTDPAGNQCTSVDPQTGYCPGTPQDLSALSQLSQSGTATTGTGTTSTGTAPTTNSEWMTDALAALPGGATSTNQSALASVLGGLTVTTAQKNVFLEAVGLVGNPPQGYPAIKTSDTAAQGTGTTGNSTSKTAGPISVVSLLPSGSGVQAKWSAAANATGGYAWKLTGPKNESGNTTGTVVTIHNLPKGSYNFGVQGLPGGQGNNAHTTIA